MSKLDSKPLTLIQRPLTYDCTEWIPYWQAIGQTWRTEPEIETDRQNYLAQRRAIAPSIEQGIYPFKDIKLSRADVEWLLATHENGHGPVDWCDGGLQERQGLDLRGADLRHMNLRRLPLTGMYGALDWEEWVSATPEQREAAVTYLEGADLSFTHMERAILRGTHLEKAILYGTHLEGTYLYTAHMEGANLKRAFFDSSTQFGKIVLANQKFGAVSLADVHWNGVNLTEVNWQLLKELGEEQKARWQKRHDRMIRNTEKQLNEFHRAVRSNRQLAGVLQEQGLNEEAVRFAYRAQKLQRVVLLLQGLQPHMSILQRFRKFSSYVFSLFLDLLAGYGYSPLKTLFWYLLVIVGFAAAYSVLGHLQLLPDALVFSFMSFHGRGFFPSLSNEINLHNPLVVLAAAEAVLGLLIEISLIATFTLRFFGK
jgi:hypothetical protein